MKALIEDIQRAAQALTDTEDTAALDAALGQVESLIYSARQRISDEWSTARAAYRPKRLILDLDDLFPIEETKGDELCERP